MKILSTPSYQNFIAIRQFRGLKTFLNIESARRRLLPHPVKKNPPVRRLRTL